MIARPGKNGHHQLPWGMNVRALDRMLPQVGVIGLTPKPRKLTNASPMMLPATISDADDDDRAEGVRQDVPEDDPPVADADGPRGLDELALADRQEQAPDEPARRPSSRTARR